MLLRPNTRWTYFNMEDPVVGGYTPEKIALRRAISMAYDEKEAIRVLLKGRAAPAQSPIPPGIAGYDPQAEDAGAALRPRRGASAARPLRLQGSRRRRLSRDARRQAARRSSSGLAPTLIARQGDELWKKNMDAIGIRMAFKKDKTPELRKMARLGKIPMRADGWNADYPDAENYMQLLYGPNAGQENQARFKLPEFDALYDRARKLPDSPERTALFDKMTELVLAYAPWRLTEHRFEDQLLQPWVGPYVPHPIKGQVLAIRRRRHEGASEIGHDEASGSITRQRPGRTPSTRGAPLSPRRSKNSARP